ncbi:putative F-box protein At3g10240 [Miscanthus floridulus]|uniref:putative F-box protein At3g10240 n=1 Tax=Miscanthus floridulus TaxID=154761 RepID=UPI003457B959
MEAKQSSKHEDDDVSLPEDIILEVLVRLPANALCRFRCVSRAWRALICDPGFVAAQRSHAGRLIVGVFGSRPHLKLRVLDMHGNVLRVFKAMHSALLAPTQLGRLICVDRMQRAAIIVDPAAGRVFTVGRNDGSTWSHSSFGRATPSGAYKVLRLHQPIAGGCEVATITDGGAAATTWRQRAPPPLVTSFSSEHKATINGVLYFMPYDTYPRTPGWNRIAAFDLEREVWMETINGPPMGWFEVEQKEWRIALTELKGTLCMVHNIQGPNYLGPYANIWRFIDYNKSVWVKAYMIRLPEECLYIKPLDVLDDGRILLLNTGCSRFILQFFNPSTKAFTDIMEMAEGFTGRMNFYTGSLLSS